MKKAILILILLCGISTALKAQPRTPVTPKDDTVTLRIPTSKLLQLYNLIGFYTQNIVTSRAKSVDVEDSKEAIKTIAPYLTFLEADTTKKVQVIVLPKHPTFSNK